MRPAVADTNIFIDLIHVNFLEALFGIDHQINTTLHVVAELHVHQQAPLSHYRETGMLNIHVLEEFKVSADIRNNSSLSESDKSLFS